MSARLLRTALPFAAMLALLSGSGCGGVSTDVFAAGDDAAVQDTATIDDANADTTEPGDSIGDSAQPVDAPKDTHADAGDVGPVCPTGSTSTPTKCPATCTGGCDADLCKIACAGLSSCSNTTLTCPNAMRCDIDCSGLNSCQNVRIFGASTGALSVTCNGVSSCVGIQMACPQQASCNLQCIGTQVCTNGVANCGAGECNLACSGVQASLAQAKCNSSCRCANTCTK
jgi:hypothetical protein